MYRWLLLLCFAPLLYAQDNDVRALLQNSADAWNRGDLVTFVSYYDDSPETTFVGREVVHGGRKAILERYQKRYPSREAMGTLAFSEIEVRSLAADVALASGKWELKRTAAGGGDASGRFTLVLRKKASGWLIIYDHSS
jgi:uncharacterized protein (TIGR02246 family)